MRSASAPVLEPVDAPVGAHDERLEFARSLDWRFLLPEPGLTGVAACTGHQELVDALRALGASVDVVTDPREHAGRYGLVVADAACARAAAALLRPDGSLYVEASGRSLRACARRLRRAGLVDVRAYWQWPRRSSCTEIVPLDEPLAIRHALARRHGSAAARLKAAAARACFELRLHRLVVADGAIVASAPGRPAGSVPDVLRRNDVAHPRRVLVVTPRFRASRHVVTLTLDRRGEPVLAIKTARLPGDAQMLAREAASLRAVAGTRAAARGTIPRLIAFEPHREHPTLVQEALRGTPLTPAAVRAAPRASVDSVLAWLRDLQGTPARRLDPASHASLVQSPLLLFGRRLGEDALVERTLAALAPLAEASVPLVFEHGDLTQPNLLRLRDGSIGVVDWELAEWTGLAGHDHTFFLAYAAFAVDRAATVPAQRETLRRALLTPGGWARDRLEAELARLDVPARLLDAIVLACWARYTTNVLLRLSGGATGAARPVPAATAAWLGANRHYALWQEALAAAEARRDG